MGPNCSESTTGPRAQSLLMGSQDTDIKHPISSTESVYDAETAPLISTCCPPESVCNHKSKAKDTVDASNEMKPQLILDHISLNLMTTT